MKFFLLVPVTVAFPEGADEPPRDAVVEDARQAVDAALDWAREGGLCHPLEDAATVIVGPVLKADSNPNPQRIEA